MDSTTGRHIAGVEHLKQSIADIITTPLGVMTDREARRRKVGGEVLGEVW